MKTILVAVDGSEPSLRGATAATELARGLGAQVTLVYAVKPILLPAGVYDEAIAKVEEGNRKVAEEALARAAQGVQSAGVSCATVTVHGAPAEAIAELAAADVNVWGVVIGARGHNAVARVLLGSVADRLVHICQKPVLVVR